MLDRSPGGANVGHDGETNRSLGLHHVWIWMYKTAIIKERPLTLVVRSVSSYLAAQVSNLRSHHPSPEGYSTTSEVYFPHHRGSVTQSDVYFPHLAGSQPLSWVKK